MESNSYQSKYVAQPSLYAAVLALNIHQMQVASCKCFKRTGKRQQQFCFRALNTRRVFLVFCLFLIKYSAPKVDSLEFVMIDDIHQNQRETSSKIFSTITSWNSNIYYQTNIKWITFVSRLLTKRTECLLFDININFLYWLRICYWNIR